MVVTFPHMGNVYISIKALMDDLHVDYILPPPTSKKTLELGTRYAPEGVCLPLKITAGNLMQAQKQGADTMLMLGAWGPCRFGYYCQMQNEILQDAGCTMDAIYLEACSEGLSELIHRIKKLTGHFNPLEILNAFKNTAQISVAIDEVERLFYKTKSREVTQGSCDRIYKSFQQKALELEGSPALKKHIRQTKLALQNVEVQPEFESLRIGIVGEIYGTIDSYASMNVQNRLATMGIESDRMVTISMWIIDHMVKKALHLPRDMRFAKAALPYVGTDIGGHTRETIGHTILHAKDGYDGIIQLYPLGCMPEIVAQAILPQVSHDYDIPVLTIIMDEMTGENGYLTRIEAFVDLLYQRKKSIVKHIEKPRFRATFN